MCVCIICECTHAHLQSHYAIRTPHTPLTPTPPPVYFLNAVARCATFVAHPPTHFYPPSTRPTRLFYFVLHGRLPKPSPPPPHIVAILPTPERGVVERCAGAQRNYRGKRYICLPLCKERQSVRECERVRERERKRANASGVGPASHRQNCRR